MNCDVAVIGTGPAGLSAAINIRQRGCSVICIGTAAEDNPLVKAKRIDNYPGLYGLTGSEMMNRFQIHALAVGVRLVQALVLNTFYTGDGWMLSAGSQVIQCHTLVFAGGVMRGKPYPGEEAYLGKGVSYCATCDGMLYRGKKVAVIGYGDADREEAKYLEGIGCSVEYVQKPKKVEILGAEQVNTAVIDGQEYAVDGVFILRPGLAPSSLFPDLALEDGFVKTDERMRTNLPRLYAAGDCTGRPLQIAKAVGDGLVAGQFAADEASAIRESMSGKAES